MEVGRQITFWFIVCCCVNIIYTEELGDNSSTTPPSEESSERSELETGNLSGIITAHKNGTKLRLTIHSKVLWKNNKSMDNMTCAVSAVEKRGEKGDKGEIGLPGTEGKVGEKGDKGEIGLLGTEGKVGEKGDKGEIGLPGTEGKVGEKGDKGEIGLPGTEGKVGGKGEKGEIGLPGSEGKMGEQGSIGIRGPQGEKGEQGKCDDSGDGRKKANYGQKENPAYSCSDIADDGPYYMNKARSFEVYCDSYRTYVSKNPIKTKFNDLEKNKKFWLSSKNLDLNLFYGTSIPNLWYLMLTHKGFKLTLTYSDEVEILEILSWTGNTESLPLSGGCKSIKQRNDLEITCTPPNYLPIDFFIEAKNEKISIELKSLYFY